MSDPFDSPVSIEKMAAFLEGNLPVEEMRRVSELIKNDETLREIVALNDECDDIGKNGGTSSGRSPKGKMFYCITDFVPDKFMENNMSCLMRDGDDSCISDEVCEPDVEEELPPELRGENFPIPDPADFCCDGGTVYPAVMHREREVAAAATPPADDTLFPKIKDLLDKSDNSFD